MKIKMENSRDQPWGIGLWGILFLLTHSLVFSLMIFRLAQRQNPAELFEMIFSVATGPIFYMVDANLESSLFSIMILLPFVLFRKFFFKNKVRLFFGVLLWTFIGFSRPFVSYT
ncbi:hypothetical protein EBQ34_13060 [Vandammella animalimorsus]|uniref:Uncharacterized protein n=1 Tax=Vandammella animalimorsus TaxID=2029117 RepID=A0A3M6R2Q7_9BURK|nr:hypothetical protein EBQ34_13060 [Vandammella animalimorsus]